MIQTDIHWEVTDTFGGEANYSWVKRGKISMKPGQDYSDLSAIRKVKKAIGWTGCRTKTETHGDMISMVPHSECQICFITFHSHGSAS